ncbi:alpha-amylase family protein [Alteromonas sp. D210916BOD_24]|uniref:alpha-amylase family protein n=1 Tax=Alteromonas sp. D210916BOD_24 TaxID=3157618 RepID=UPI00399CFD39
MLTLKATPSFKPVILSMFSLGLMACTEPTTMNNEETTQRHIAATQNSQIAVDERQGKPVVYQVFTRLYGNTNTTNKPWGTLEENGVGKFTDFTEQALASIKALGTSHVWYTGVPHHALVTDYSEFGISVDDPDVVKGRAGSPYAVKDYYNVNPDLATDPAKRLEEFEALVKRTHEAGLQVIIDIVPNHVARDYTSLSAPEGVTDFGENDDTSVVYAKHNNFYYVVGEDFVVPSSANYQVLGGESHPLSDGQFQESPAKWTGNGARAAQPDINDWYETVKVNYGVKPDGSYDFPVLPQDYATKSYAEHNAFWQDKDLPDSWYKFRDIAHYWLDKGVDGFRYDMAEMVPVEFWSFLNSSIKAKNPNAFLLAEVYQPAKYRDYIQLGKMDYLYDKVGFYDMLKLIMQGNGKVSDLVAIHQEIKDIAPHMLHFLENHDEQRIASPDFAGNALKGKPALAVSALISASPTLLYFGQDVGEDGSEDMGFGDPTRTTIFDYAGVPAHQRFMNNGQFDGGQSTKDELALRAFYEQVMAIAKSNPAINGELVSLHSENLAIHNSAYSESQMAFARVKDGHGFVVLANFSEEAIENIVLTIPENVLGDVGQHVSLSPLLDHESTSFNKEADSYSAVIRLQGLQTKVFSF